MEIQWNSSLIDGRNKRCVKTSSISIRSWGHGEFENLIPHSVQRAHKPWRACHYIRIMQRRIVPSMEIQGNSGLIHGRNKRCTRASSISTRSWGHGEFETVLSHLVRRADKLWRACQYIRLRQRCIVASMKIQGNFGLILGRNKRCTKASSISTRSWGHGEFENLIPHSVQRAHKPWRACQYIRRRQRVCSAVNGNSSKFIPNPRPEQTLH